jgi:hypothetical protein
MLVRRAVVLIAVYIGRWGRRGEVIDLACGIASRAGVFA